VNHFESVKKSYHYEEFISLMEILVANGETTGPDQSESLIFYTKLNLQRMQRWDKVFQLNEALASSVRKIQPQTWWVINEAWCGDAAQCLPMIRKMEIVSSGNIEVRIILRDENLSIMDQYLTDTSRSIPKLISLDKEGNELFIWGPRPKFAQQMMMDWKANNNGKTLDDIEREIHLWYSKDKGQSLQEEFLEILNNRSIKKPD